MKSATTISWGRKPVSELRGRKIQALLAVALLGLASPSPVRAADTTKLTFNRQRLALPTSGRSTAVPAVDRVDLQAVKPPRSGDFYGAGDSKEAAYEGLVDQEIAQLYTLSKRYEKSKTRGELWLRLAEQYVEKARLVGFRSQAEYDLKARAFLERKTRVKPKLDVRLQRDYNRKAVELYQWFVREFPEDKKIDQALFFLGYNWFELGDTKKGEAYYLQLTQRFPGSSYVVESYFALGEYDFENERWQEGLDNYTKVIARKNARLNTLALYKAAWCLFRVSRVPTALKMLERVVKLGAAAADSNDGSNNRKAVNKLRLSSEALKDYVPFYAETGEYANARSEFLRVSGSEAQANKMLERLAYTYADRTNRMAANLLFKQLIASNPTAEKAASYQYQIALTFQTSDQRQYRHELEAWLENFGPESFWAKENVKNPKSVADMAKLQETTARNFVLQLHQTAQNSHAPFSQQQAAAGYSLYAKYLPSSPKTVEMTFFHAELLFDMEKYEDAARLYGWVAEHEPKGPYGEKATLNAMLALEKELPSQQAIEERRGKSLEPVALDPASERFEKAVTRYRTEHPHDAKASDAERRLGVLYYQYNQFDKAMDMFERIIHEHPKSANAEIAGNLILDMYKLKGDVGGLVVRGEKFLRDPQIARTPFGQQVKAMMEKASYLNAERLAEAKDYSKSAAEFQHFSENHRASELAEVARYKAAANYEKAGDVASSIHMHGAVLAAPSENPKTKAIQNDSRNDLARLYGQTAQLEAAAKQYQSYAAANPKDQKAINAYYNAGVLFDALGESEAAIRNYELYHAKSLKQDRTEVVFFEAEIQRKGNEFPAAARLYERYLNEGGRLPERIVQSRFWVATIADRAGQASKAHLWYLKTLEGFKAGKHGVRFAAEARFRLAHETLAQIEGLRFRSSEKQQAQAVQQGEALRKSYVEEMKAVIRFDHAPFIVAALASTGQMFEYLATAYSNVPTPPGYSAEDAKKLADLALGRAKGFRNEAKASYKAAFDKGLELESYGEWTKFARAGLARYDAAAAGSDGQEVTAASNSPDWMGM